MNALYTAFLYFALPFALARLLWRSLRMPAYRQRLAERFGRIEPPPPGGLWLHAVSVGETQAAAPLVKQLLARHPDLPLIMTTTTPTGSRQVRDLFGDRVHHYYFPYDLPFAVRGFLDAAKPRLLVMMETEIWPNLLRACEARDIVTMLANARLSEHSARGYARIASFSRQVFQRIGMVAAQAELDAERFRALGVSDKQVQVTGSIKFDMGVPASLRERAEALRVRWRDRPVWMAASTHEGEEEAVLKVHAQILREHSDALLILAPRHPDRAERVLALCRRAGFETQRRTEGALNEDRIQVFLLDTIGELTLFLATADLAFVGGSLVATGGHNILEPAALGVPVVFGPYMFNFPVIARLMVEQQAAIQVPDAEVLSQVAIRWLGDASERTGIGENGLRVVEENRGATERLLALVECALAETAPIRPPKIVSGPSNL